MELKEKELLEVNGGASWDDLGFYAATGGGAMVGASLGGPVGALIGGAVAGAGYILIGD